MEHSALQDGALRVAFLTACGRAELGLALQHHPDSPYRDTHDHPVADHVAAIRRSIAEAGAIIAALRDNDLPAEQRGPFASYVEACAGYLGQELAPACDALLAGDFGEANKHLHCQGAPLSICAAGAAGPSAQAGEAEQTLVNLSVILGISLAASTVWIGTHL